MLAMLLLFGLVAWTMNAQQPKSFPALTAFTATDGAFRFSYPHNFQVCTAGKMDPCNLSSQSFIPVCEDEALVCVIFPPARVEGTNFGDASFQVKEIHRGEMVTDNVCATPYPKMDASGPSNWPEFLVSAKHPVEMIGGVQFLHGISGGVATGHWLDVELYRSSHRQRCFELRVSTTQTNPEITEPPMKTLTRTQKKELDQSMSRILHSFRFLN